MGKRNGSTLPGVIVVGGHINGLGLARALAAQGLRVAVITTQAYDLAHRSRAVCDWIAAPGLDDAPALLRDALAARATEWAGWALVPSNDGALIALDHAREWLAPRHPWCAPEAGTVPSLTDKATMRAAALRAGLSLPRNYGRAESTNPALAQVEFPVVVKPHTSQPFGRLFGRKLFVIRDRPALDDAIARVTAAGVPCDVDAFIEGGDDQIIGLCLYFGDGGHVSRAVIGRKLRQGPPFTGVARVVELATDEVLPRHEAALLRDAVVSLLHPFRFRGFADAEFKRDTRTGRWHFIEVNCRSVLYNSLLRRGGLDVAALTVAHLTTGRVPDVTPIAWPGVWVNFHADLLYSLAHRRDDPMPWRRFVGPYRRPVIDAVWSAQDPRPALAQWAHTAGRAVRAVTG